MRSSRMRTARWLTVSCSIPYISRGVCLTPPPPRVGRPGGRGRSAKPPRCRPPWIQTPLVMWPAMHAGKPPPPPWTEWQMLVKILSCPKLRLRVVINKWTRPVAVSRSTLVWTRTYKLCLELKCTGSTQNPTQKPLYWTMELTTAEVWI